VKLLKKYESVKVRATLFDRKTEDASCCRKICAASLLIHEFFMKHETTVVPQPPHSPNLASNDFFFVPEVEILNKRSPISDGREDKRNFDTGPSRRPAKHVPEIKKTFGSGVSRVEGSTVKVTSLINL